MHHADSGTARLQATTAERMSVENALLTVNLLYRSCVDLTVWEERPLVSEAGCSIHTYGDGDRKRFESRLKGYLWSKLYQILKGQALSCLVFLRCDPSNTAELC